MALFSLFLWLGNRFWSSSSFSRSLLDLNILERLHKMCLSGSRLPLYKSGRTAIPGLCRQSACQHGGRGWAESWHLEITCHRHPLNPHGKRTAIVTLCRWGNGAGEITRAPRVVRARAWTLAARLQTCAITLCAALAGGGGGALMSTVHQKRTRNRQMKEEACEDAKVPLWTEMCFRFLCVSKEPPRTPRSPTPAKGWFMRICSSLPAG